MPHKRSTNSKYARQFRGLGDWHSEERHIAIYHIDDLYIAISVVSSMVALSVVAIINM